jgi:hypothetical protein
MLKDVETKRKATERSINRTASSTSPGSLPAVDYGKGTFFACNNGWSGMSLLIWSTFNCLGDCDARVGAGLRHPVCGDLSGHVNQLIDVRPRVGAPSGVATRGDAGWVLPPDGNLRW